MSASALLRTSVANAESIPLLSLAWTASIAHAMDAAAAVTSLLLAWAFVLSVLNSSPIRAPVGTSSLSRPRCFAPSSDRKKCTPVALPPGRAMLATRPSVTGSSIELNTIGMFAVAPLAATAAVLEGRDDRGHLAAHQFFRHHW